MLRIAVIEDDCQDLLIIRELLEKLLEKKSISYSLETFESIPPSPSDLEDFSLIFLDVEIRKQSGIDLGIVLATLYPDIVLVLMSAHPRYLLDGYQTHAERFFLKPLDESVFDFEMSSILKAAQSGPGRGIKDSRIAPYRILFSEIMYIEFFQRKTVVHFLETKPLYTTLSLSEWIHLCEGEPFAQPYKCYLVNLKSVATVSNRELCLSDGTRLPVSRHFRSEFISRFETSRRRQ